MPSLLAVVVGALALMARLLLLVWVWVWVWQAGIAKFAVDYPHNSGAVKTTDGIDETPDSRHHDILAQHGATWTTIRISPK